MKTNLDGCSNPRVFGKGLTAQCSGEWSYRVGSYRTLCDIDDFKVVIHVFSIGYRSTVYKT
ncbi:type II toxin-antitoxin system RelE/ParE family toxin [Actinotignum urinale]|uniref:Type II toxin-antitoxin system RelE/ParE family toxin n=1 Tax=Actinotignum urinale TaxID=190146 RepID=A0AAW9HVA4_9ACTO|nr:type II toxin-antitoxin system RelE/ParE family toxin [Actinotignum urinale]MDY5132475.1 type II toxin-antitoxin system RelE/ParE family toxin [Actinotignum urinale]MDY5154769.1 type II toxin-antitoxin system RelE/ParE family toxin [Actinotignum urinale]